MASPLTQAGALSDPSSYAPLHTNRLFTGLWTNRSPLRDAATSYLQEKYYSASRQDSIWRGFNSEITSRLTLRRRPGLSVYNSQIFPPINRFYEFRQFSTQAERINVIVDTAATVYDGTGPATKTALFTKSAGAGKTSFLSVGNTLYMGNGKDQMKVVGSALTWQPATAYNAGDFIIDPNNNIQMVSPSVACSIGGVSITGGVALFTIYPPQRFATHCLLAVAGMTTATFLNGQTLSVQFQPNLNIVQCAVAHADYAGASDTGTLTIPAPTTSGAAAPAWDPGYGVATVDNGLVWINKGSATQGWGIAAPTTAPTIGTSPLPSIYPAWAAGTRYTASLGVVDAAHHVQVLTTGGVTGSSEPAWNDSPYLATTPDGTCVWTNYGDVNWHGATAYAVGALISVTFTYYITSYSSANNSNSNYGYEGNYQAAQQQQQQQPTKTTTAITVTNFFSCTQAGVTGASQPAWVQGQGSSVADGTVVWANGGPSTTWANDIKAGAKLSLAPTIVDANGNLQNIVTAGVSGAAAPAWATAPGAMTQDGGCVWSCGGPYSAANTGSQIYSYAWGSTVSGERSNLSPLSAPITRGTNQLVTLQGVSGPNVNQDIIYIYRTVQGRSTQLFLASIPSTGPGNMWSFQDALPDDALNAFIQGAQGLQLTPPPAGFSCMTYHLQRIFGAVENVVYYSAGPDALIFGSSGNSGFPPLNSFTVPSRVVRLWPCAIGLFVFTVSDAYLIGGTGTASDPLYILPFQDGLGLLSYDGFTVNGSTPYLITNSKMIVSLDPSAGVVEAGFPIADQIERYYNEDSHLTWHSQTSADTALYAGDGIVGWYRYSAATAPESGSLWSPQAVITGGCRALQSVETTPGTNQLLVAPYGGGQILFRDPTVNTDVGAPFVVETTFGSIVLAQPGQLAALAFFTLESPKIGRRPNVAVLLGEISGLFAPDPTSFERVKRTVQDPPLLPPSDTLYSDRYHLMGSEDPVYCRHFQLDLGWGAEDAASELWTYTIFGSLLSEFKSQ